MIFYCKVYKGLDIITNKMPLEEREGIKHHLMDFLEPEEEYKVTSFLRDASQKVRLFMTILKCACSSDVHTRLSQLQAKMNYP